MGLQAPFWEILVSYSEAEGEHKVDALGLCSLRAPLYLLDVCKPEACPQAGLASRPLPQKGWGCVSPRCSALGVAACQELSLQLLQSCGTREHNPPPRPPELDMVVIKPRAPGVC